MLKLLLSGIVLKKASKSVRMFAGFWWRIIRVNGNGSIRIIYQGVADSETPDAGNVTGTETQIRTSKFNNLNDNKAYVGLVYEKDEQHGYEKLSTMMNVLNTWYNNNLANYKINEDNYIDTQAGFCSDREVASDSNWNSAGNMYYAPHDRQDNGSLLCNELDVLSQDNGKLPNPIGLLTSDEYVLAGKESSFLNVKIYYWTMSPCYYNGISDVFYIYSSGYLGGNGNPIDSYGVRPVINLRNDVSITGSGTVTDPFIVVGA